MGRPFARGSGDPLSYSPHEGLEEDREGVTRNGSGELPALADGRPSSSGVLAEEFDFEDSVLSTIASSAKIESLIASALAGKLPRDRALKPNEPDRLNPRHIQVIMMRAVGYRQIRIAELTGYEKGVVCNILSHPDSRTILSAILTTSAKTAVTIASTVQAYAPDMLKIVRDIAENKQEKTPVRLKAAFHWLNMYGDTQSGVKDDEKPLSLTDESANRLTEAIREAQKATDVSFVVVEQGSGSPSEESPSLDPASLPAGAPDTLESLHDEVEAVLTGLDRPA